MRIRKPDVLERNWGREILAIRTRTHAGKVLERAKGTKGGFQMHIKEESHYLLSGRVLLRTYEAGQVVEQIAETGDAWTVEPLTLHQEEALEDSVVFEVSDTTSDDRFGIVPDPGALPSMSDRDAIEKLLAISYGMTEHAQRCQIHAGHVLRLGLAKIAEAQQQRLPEGGGLPTTR